MHEILLGKIVVGRLIIIVCLLYALRYLRTLSDNTDKIEVIAENLENLHLLRRLEGKELA